MKNYLRKLLYLLPAMIWLNGFAQTTYDVPERIYYKFNTVGTTVANDASAPVGTNPATISGLTVGAGGFSATNGLIGTGQTSTGNTVNTGWNTDLTGDFTIAFWTSAVPTSTTLYYIFGDNGASGFRCFTNGVAGAGNWIVRGSFPDLLLTGGATNASHMMHVVYDATALTMTGYVDGVQVDQVTLATPLNETGTGLTVGGYQTNTGLNGVLDEYRWYGRALDANEVQLTYNQELPFTVVCGVPQNFTESNIGTNSVDITWDHGGGNDNYEIEYGLAGFTPGTGSVITGPIVGASTTETITGLSPNTTYDYYITEDCNGGANELTFGEYTFTTACGVESTPFAENFDGPTWDAAGGDINSCWSRNPATGFAFSTNSGGTPSGSTGPSDDFTGGGNYVYTEGSSGISGDVATITSPEIDLSSLSSPYLTFYYHMYGADITSLDVEISNNGGTTWTSELTIVGEQQASNGGAWVEQAIDLSAYVNDIVQVRFSTSKGGSFNCDVSIDQLEIAEAPTCPKPTDFISTFSTDETIDLSWTNGGTETMWNIEYGPTGFIQGSLAGTFVPITTNPYTITNLTPNTAYDIYIQANCGGGDESDWVGPINVQTQCASFTAPYLESFDIGSLPACWLNTSSNTGSANGTWKFTGTPGYAAGNNGRPAGTFAWSDGSTPEVSDVTLISPLVDMSALTIPTLSFDWFSNNEDNPGDNVPLIVDINDGNGWTNLLTLSGDNVNWQDEEITLGAYIGQTVQFRFITDQTATSGSAYYNDILLDSVMVDEGPTCPRPTPVIASNISATSADIAWGAGFQESEWIVEYDTTGFSLGTGNTLVTTNLSETLNNLSSNTTYDVYVRAICGIGDTSAYRGPANFQTPCVDYIAPFYQNFDGSSEWVSGTGFNNNGDAISQCWSRIPVQATSAAFWGTRTGTTSGGTTGPDTDYSGSGNYMYFESSYGSTGDTAELITPSIDMSNIDDPILTFYYHMYGASTGILQAEISNDGGATWDSLYAEVGQQQTAGDDAWEKVTVELFAYEDETVLIRFLGVKDGTSGDVAIDEVSVYPCNPATGQDGDEDICRFDELFDLNSSIVKGQENGSWSFPSDNDLIEEDTLFNVSLLPAGSYDVYYIVPGGCDDDTTVATVNVFPPSSAGQNGNIEVCLNEPIDLFSGLNGNADLGGTWYDPSNTAIVGSQPVASGIPGNYNYDYIVSNGVCPADTSLIVVTVNGGCDYLSIGEEKLSEITVYPNPAKDVVNISNPSNSEALTIEMFDVNGRVVLSDENALVNASETSLDIQHLQKGIYTLRIYNDEGQRTFKVIKQ